MESTIDAENIPKPAAGTCNLISSALTKGATVNKPQKPYTTDGMAARSSITFRNMLGITPFGKYSPKKSAAAIENGADINSAKKDVIRVPIKNGNMP